MLGRVDVSGEVLEKKILRDGAKQGTRFLLGLYKHKGCFFISSFLAGKEAKEAGGTYEWFPLDPLSTFDGDAVPLDSPCSGGGGRRFSSGGGADGTVRATFHRRATLGLNLC